MNCSIRYCSRMLKRNQKMYAEKRRRFEFTLDKLQQQKLSKKISAIWRMRSQLLKFIPSTLKVYLKRLKFKSRIKCYESNEKALAEKCPWDQREMVKSTFILKCRFTSIITWAGKMAMRNLKLVFVNVRFVEGGGGNQKSRNSYRSERNVGYYGNCEVECIWNYSFVYMRVNTVNLYKRTIFRRMY